MQRIGVFVCHCGSNIAATVDVKKVVEINKSGTTILLVEQNANMALSIANRAYVLETGKIVIKGNANEMLNNESIRAAYLGE